jgi:CMP-N-acetylneuraminic acid synthetase
MKTVAVVPIKLNSVRLPNKNIKNFKNGNPLCYYIFQTLLKLKTIENVYVYCSDIRIKNFLPKGVKYLRRSTDLDKDSTKINEVLSAFAKDIPADVYIMAHATAPFIDYKNIESGLSAVYSGEYDSAFSVIKLQSFFWMNNKPLNYQLNKIPRTQDLDPFFMETSGFYIYKSDTILNQNRRIGEHPFLVEVSTIESIDIDTKEDFDIAEALFNHLLLQN